MEYIIEEARNLPHEDVIKLTKMIYNHDTHCLTFNSTGARVKLDKLPGSLIDSMYAFVSQKVAREIASIDHR